MSLEPLVYINYSSRDADSLEVAYSKYNSHFHSEVTKLNFYTYDINIGDEVYIQSINNTSIFTETCTVVSFTEVGLVLSTTALNSIENGTAVINGVLYNSITITQNSNLLRIVPENGVLNARASQHLQTVILRGTLNYKLNGKTFLSLGRPYKLRLTKLRYYARSTASSIPSLLNVVKSEISNDLVVYLSAIPFSTDTLVTHNLPLNSEGYILNPTDFLYIEITNGTNLSSTFNNIVLPLLDYEVEGYIIS